MVCEEQPRNDEDRHRPYGSGRREDEVQHVVETHQYGVDHHREGSHREMEHRASRPDRRWGRDRRMHRDHQSGHGERPSRRKHRKRIERRIRSKGSSLPRLQPYATRIDVSAFPFHAKPRTALLRTFTSGFRPRSDKK